MLEGHLWSKALLRRGWVLWDLRSISQQILPHRHCLHPKCKTMKNSWHITKRSLSNYLKLPLKKLILAIRHLMIIGIKWTRARRSSTVTRVTRSFLRELMMTDILLMLALTIAIATLLPMINNNFGWLETTKRLQLMYSLFKWLQEHAR